MGDARIRDTGLSAHDASGYRGGSLLCASGVTCEVVEVEGVVDSADSAEGVVRSGDGGETAGRSEDVEGVANLAGDDTGMLLSEDP